MGGIKVRACVFFGKYQVYVSFRGEQQTNYMDNSPSLPSNPTSPEQTNSDNPIFGKEFAQLRHVFLKYMCDIDLNYHKTIPAIEQVLKEHPELLPRLLPATNGVDYEFQLLLRINGGTGNPLYFSGTASAVAS